MAELAQSQLDGNGSSSGGSGGGGSGGGGSGGGGDSGRRVVTDLACLRSPSLVGCPSAAAASQRRVAPWSRAHTPASHTGQQCQQGDCVSSPGSHTPPSARRHSSNGVAAGAVDKGCAGDVGGGQREGWLAPSGAAGSGGRSQRSHRGTSPGATAAALPPSVDRDNQPSHHQPNSRHNDLWPRSKIQKKTEERRGDGGSGESRAEHGTRSGPSSAVHGSRRLTAAAAISSPSPSVSSAAAAAACCLVCTPSEAVSTKRSTCPSSNGPVVTVATPPATSTAAPNCRRGTTRPGRVCPASRRPAPSGSTGRGSGKMAVRTVLPLAPDQSREAEGGRRKLRTN